MIEFLQANLGSVILALGVATFFLLFRNRTSRISEIEEVLGKGQPVIVELFSNT